MISELLAGIAGLFAGGFITAIGFVANNQKQMVQMQDAIEEIKKTLACITKVEITSTTTHRSII